MALPADYLERVYAGVLGKVIGVYLGRPFEGWTHERILRELGEVWYYVNERLGRELVVTDDDISGTFSFVRALEDSGKGRAITPADIGQGWLNYIIENKTILWWGGVGMSTEHTAYQRLKRGIQAPDSGSIKLNGKVVAEQIGSQIFIDGWAIAAPGDPALAAELAGKAASVSHDGEAIYGAQVIAAMEAAAFVERDLGKLFDIAVGFIPRQSVIYRMIAELRERRARDGDWRAAFRDVMQKNYGYDKFGGNCHIVPNHGVVILALLWGDDDFQKSLMIANTCGWDTDCNSGNVGCVMGIKNGLAGIDAGPDWRGPVADRIYLPTADGGRGITDAATEALHLVNMGRRLAGETLLAPKDGARFHFELPGSVQGFIAEGPGTTLENVRWNGSSGKRALAIRYQHLATGQAARAGTATFMSPGLAAASSFYAMFASPTLHSGQSVRAVVAADQRNTRAVSVRIFVRVYNGRDQLELLQGEGARIGPGETAHLTFVVPQTDGFPVAEAGIEITGDGGANGTIYLDYLRWDGEPETVFRRPGTAAGESGTMYRRAWVGDVEIIPSGDEDFRLAKNEGRGVIAVGTNQWRDYRVQARMTPHLAKSFGLAVRCQGLRRFYGLVLERSGGARLIKMAGEEQELARRECAFEFGESYELWIEAKGRRISAGIGENIFFDIADESRPLEGGGAGVILEEGRMGVWAVKVTRGGIQNPGT